MAPRAASEQSIERLIGVGQQSHAYEARQGRSYFGGSKIADEQFPTIRAETVVNGFGGRLGDQRRQEDTGIQIGTQSSFDSYIRPMISTDVNPMLGRARVRARSHS